jgi:hypothetical protein
MRNIYRSSMTRISFVSIFSAFALSIGIVSPLVAQSFVRGVEQDAARRRMLDGEVMPFSIIKRRVESAMGGATYVGVAPPPREGVYRMQFLRPDGQVIWVDVDGKTGDIIGRTKTK